MVASTIIKNHLPKGTVIYDNPMKPMEPPSSSSGSRTRKWEVDVDNFLTKMNSRSKKSDRPLMNFGPGETSIYNQNSMVFNGGVPSMNTISMGSSSSSGSRQQITSWPSVSGSRPGSGSGPTGLIAPPAMGNLSAISNGITGTLQPRAQTQGNSRKSSRIIQSKQYVQTL